MKDDVDDNQTKNIDEFFFPFVTPFIVYTAGHQPFGA